MLLKNMSNIVRSIDKDIQDLHTLTIIYIL